MNPNFKKFCQKIADENGVSIKQVIWDMQKAIDEGFSNPDPDVQAEWAKIPCKGSRPTPEELIVYQVQKLKNDSPYKKTIPEHD